MVLPEDRGAWPELAREAWEERAAIREHLGGQDRATAEREAEEDVRREWLRRAGR